MILQYAERDLVATIKTTPVSPVSPAHALKYWVRGTNGVFVKNGEDVQIEQMVERGMKPDEEGFGVEPERYCAYLTTREASEGKFERPSSEMGVKFDGKVCFDFFHFLFSPVLMVFLGAE